MNSNCSFYSWSRLNVEQFVVNCWNMMLGLSPGRAMIRDILPGRGEADPCVCKSYLSALFTIKYFRKYNKSILSLIFKCFSLRWTDIIWWMLYTYVNTIGLYNRFVNIITLSYSIWMFLCKKKILIRYLAL